MHEASSRISAMLDIASLLNQSESEHHAFQLAAADGHFNGFAPVNNKILGVIPTDHHCVSHRPYHQDPSLGLVKGEPAGGDQQSAMSMSNLTSASGEVSGGSTSGERGTTITGGGGGGSTCQQVTEVSGATTSTSGATQLPPLGLTVAVKRKRNLPGTPDPDAEVIALSPKTLMATNRFVCEICNKGFQRDQNLQLHRRGHNLPWKLRQRTSKEVRKRVYICPEVKCVHHDPARALGDLTGIKKHFCRKHGEKKWKCDKCSKRYAVQSDWKAHSKTCGTREYRCDCGTLFSRRDSFITHRAFCDALAEESARVNSGGHNMNAIAAMQAAVSVAGGPGSRMGHQQGGAPSPMSSSLAVENSLMSRTGGAVSSRPRLSLWLGSGPASSTTPNHLANEHLILSANAAEAAAAHDLGLNITTTMDNNSTVRNAMAMASLFGSLDYEAQKQQFCAASMGMVPPGGSGGSNGGLSYAMGNGLISSGGQGMDMQGHELGALAGLGAPDQYSGLTSWPHEQRLPAGSSNRLMPQYMSSSPLLRSASSGNNSTNTNVSAPSPLSYYNNGLAGVLSPLSCTSGQANATSSTASAQMSATALLQKAAQMGATASNTSLLKGLGAHNGMAGSDTSNRLAPWQLNPMDHAAAGGISSLVQSYPFNARGAHNDDHHAGDNPDASASSSSSSSSSTMMMMMQMRGQLIANHSSGVYANPNIDDSPAIASLHHQLHNTSSSMMKAVSSPSSSLMGFGRGEEADKLTRDFLGVRGLSSILQGSSSSSPTPTNSFSQRDSCTPASSEHACNHSSAKESMGFLQHEQHVILNSVKSKWDELDGHRL